MTKDAIPIKPGDPCPLCGGTFVPRAEGPQAADKVADKGVLHRCTGCGYYTRLK